MTMASKQKKIDDLMDKVSESLVRTAYFEAERMASKAMGMARQEDDFERMARIVEMRVFVGMTAKEIAHVLRISRRTVQDDWQVAKMWLSRELAAEVSR